MNEKQDMKDIWNPNLYDTKHSFISNYGTDLIELLAPKPHEKILDLGCGTGDLANKLYHNKVNIVGVDKSKKMIMQAKDKFPNIEFLVGDATNLKHNNAFDAVFSNATLHWIKTPEQALKSIYRSLKQDGRFIAEFGGKGNVQTITDELIKQMKEAGFDYNIEQFPWYFPSIGEYSSLMESVGFKVTFAEHFDRPTRLEGDDGLRNWIKMFCSYMFKDINKSEVNDLITKAENNLKEKLYIGGNWIADYKRIRLIGIKQ